MTTQPAPTWPEITTRRLTNVQIAKGEQVIATFPTAIEARTTIDGREACAVLPVHENLERDAATRALAQAHVERQLRAELGKLASSTPDN